MDWRWPKEADWKGEKGEITWQKERYIVLLMNMVPAIEKETSNTIGEVARTIVYNAAYRDSKIAVENFLSNNIAGLVSKLGIMDKKIAERTVNLLTQQGLGKGEFIEYDPPENVVVEIKNSFESDYYLKKGLKPEKPVCNAMRGMIAGAATAITGTDMNAKEVKCRALGDNVCRFHISSEKQI